MIYEKEVLLVEHVRGRVKFCFSMPVAQSTSAGEETSKAAQVDLFIETIGVC